MIESFKDFLYSKLKAERDDRFLIAVSGGVDSMVLWHLARMAGLNYCIAHCNFKLRGEEADLDEQFVKSHAVSNEMVVVKSFKTLEYAEKSKCSIQVAARELRYRWFRELLIEQHCKFIATAHHLDDQVETFFIQLLRNGRPAALKGMPFKSNEIIRPLMFLDKSAITSFAKTNGIEFREDTSNDSDKYLRNQVRHHLIPALNNIDSQFKGKVIDYASQMNELSEMSRMYSQQTDLSLKKIDGETIKYNIDTLLQLKFPETFIHWLLSQNNFSNKIFTSLIAAIGSQSGKVFYSHSNRLIVDRTDLILTPLTLNDQDNFTYTLSTLLSSENDFLEAEILTNFNIYELSNAENGVSLDFDQLKEPIIFRKWKSGDSFKPLGLKGSKKLSDFFIDEKYSLVEKERQWIMTSGGEICWLVGKRLDDRYKVTENTKQILSLKMR